MKKEMHPISVAVAAYGFKALEVLIEDKACEMLDSHLGCPDDVNHAVKLRREAADFSKVLVNCLHDLFVEWKEKQDISINE